MIFRKKYVKSHEGKTLPVYYSERTLTVPAESLVTTSRFR